MARARFALRSAVLSFGSVIASAQAIGCGGSIAAIAPAVEPMPPPTIRAFVSAFGDGKVYLEEFDGATGQYLKRVARVSTYTAKLALSPSGAYLYVTAPQVRAGAGIAAYAVSTGAGEPPPVPGSPFEAGLSFEAVAVDPTGRFLYATHVEEQDPANSVAGYGIDPV